MAPKKLPAKRSRKDATREGSSAALQAGMDFDGHKFRIVEHQQRFEAIKGMCFSALVACFCKFRETMYMWIHACLFELGGCMGWS